MDWSSKVGKKVSCRKLTVGKISQNKQGGIFVYRNVLNFKRAQPNDCKRATIVNSLTKLRRNYCSRGFLCTCPVSRRPDLLTIRISVPSPRHSKLPRFALSNWKVMLGKQSAARPKRGEERAKGGGHSRNFRIPFSWFSAVSSSPLPRECNLRISRK